MMKKVCSRCQRSLPVADFHKRGDGLQSMCKACKKDADDERYATRRDEILTRQRAQKAAQRVGPERDHILSRERAWRQTPTGQLKVNRSGRARRARVKGATRHASRAELAARLEEYGGKCAYCAFADHEEWDHYIPVSRGGTDTIENLFPSCRACNRDKWAKLPIFEWVGRLT